LKNQVLGAKMNKVTPRVLKRIIKMNKLTIEELDVLIQEHWNGQVEQAQLDLRKSGDLDLFKDAMMIASHDLVESLSLLFSYNRELT
jgi:hypothetical protein